MKINFCNKKSLRQYIKQTTKKIVLVCGDSKLEKLYCHWLVNNYNNIDIVSCKQVIANNSSKEEIYLVCSLLETEKVCQRLRYIMKEDI